MQQHTQQVYFNPRSRERSDSVLCCSSTRFSISIHAPARGATMNPVNAFQIPVFQSTLPREERRWLIKRFNTVEIISIHAPARGATNAFIHNDNNYSISIHAPARGATNRVIHKFFFRRLFQSTLPREERQQYCTKNLFIFIQYRQ